MTPKEPANLHVFIDPNFRTHVEVITPTGEVFPLAGVMDATVRLDAHNDGTIPQLDLSVFIENLDVSTRKPKMK